MTMPKPNELCVVTALGQKYDIWQSVEVTHSTDDVIDHAMLTVSEPSSGAKSLAALKLKPGDAAQVHLAGQLVLDGRVYLRQTAYDNNSHGVQIGIASKAQALNPSTVDASPGQYTNATLQQIASAGFGKAGVKFSIDGNPAGANIPFARVSEHVGETRFNFIERLCRMRNLHMVDDGQGGIVAFRGPRRGTNALREGFNILRGQLLLKNNEHLDDLKVVGQDANRDSAYDNAQVSASAKVDPPVSRSMTLIAEELGDQRAMQMRADHEADFVKYNLVDGVVTTQGWLCPDGSLWFAHLRELITVESPMLVPDQSMIFMIKGIAHRQSSQEGTITNIMLCRADGLGAGAEPLREK